MKTKKMHKHETECFTCFDMLRRGYCDDDKDHEAEYWDDFFDRKEKPIIYALTWRNKPFEEKDIKEVEEPMEENENKTNL